MEQSEFQSGGIYRENHLSVRTTLRASTRSTLFNHNTLPHANSDTSTVTDLPTSPSNQLEGYGRSPFDLRNHFFQGGVAGLSYDLRPSPFLVASSGYPYNLKFSLTAICGSV